MSAEIEITEAPTALYRLYAADAALLYVGITGNLRMRLTGHAKKSWWPQVARKTVEWHTTRRDASVAESVAIRVERPLHNKDLNGTRAHFEKGKCTEQVRMGLAIRAMREAHGVTRPELARAVGVTAGLIGHIEGGVRNPSHPVRRKIVDTLGEPLAAITVANWAEIRDPERDCVSAGQPYRV